MYGQIKMSSSIHIFIIQIVTKSLESIIQNQIVLCCKPYERLYGYQVLF